MYARFDFMSEKTGRVLLSTLLDAPQDRLPTEHIAAVLRILASTKKKLEAKLGEGLVRLSLDGYETSVFWAIVLFRPLTIQGERKSVYDILLEGGAEVLQKTDVGVVFEPEHGFLILDWEAAKEGVLEKIDDCPSWQKIVEKAAKRAKKEEWDSSEYMRRCAESHSWVVPEWILHKMKFLRGTLWFRPALTYSDITVLDTRGIEIIRLEGEGKGVLNEAELMTARTLKFVHHYTTSDKREFRSAHYKQKLATRDPEKFAAQEKERKYRQRLRRKGIEIEGGRKNWKRREFESENRKWYLASRVIGQLPKYLGKGYRGKYPPLMTAPDSEKRLKYTLDAYMNGELVKPKWRRVDALLRELEDLLKDKRVPREFGDWLIWRNKGKHVPAYLARRNLAIT